MKIGESTATIFRFLVPINFIVRCVKSLLKFSSGWIRTRNWKRIVPASIPFFVIIVLAWSLVAHRLPWRRQQIVQNYKAAATNAAEVHDIAGYRLAFRRMLEMSGGGPSLQFEFASTLYELGEHNEALRMMSGMAPLNKRGYEPAHRFLLSKMQPGESRQSDLIRAVHLSHIIGLKSDARSERLELVKLLAGYKNYDRAEDVLRPTLDKYPEDSLTIARMKAHAGDVQAARSEARHACKILRPIVHSDPDNIERRIQLAQGHIFLADPANALQVLLENQSASADIPVPDRLCEAMASTFAIWLNLMPLEQQSVQRTCLKRLAALPESQTPKVRQAEDPKAATIARVASAVDDRHFFASVMKSSRRNVVIPFLRGTIAATNGDWSTAEQQLRSALVHAADDPSINNNLALIVMNNANGLKDSSVRLKGIQEALLMAARSVDASPEIAEFHETYAQVLALSGSHALAVAEWKQCLTMGLSTRQIHRSLAASLRSLGLSSEANQHELESQNAAF